METIIYLLKVNLYFALFYACYWLLLRRHTFFRLNRFYLVSTLFLSFALPLIEFTDTVILMPVGPNMLHEYPGEANDLASKTSMSWMFGLAVYCIGAVLMLSRFLLGFYRLFRLYKQSEKIKLEDFTMILLPGDNEASKNPGSFSFFNVMAVSHYDYENHFDTILQHESVHINQYHSLDILLIEILKIAFWINPVLWFYKISLREIHEFLADDIVESKYNYANFLVSYAQNSTFESITNNFFSSFLLKDRIKMMYRKSTSYWALSKYLLIVAVIIFTVQQTAAHRDVFITAYPVKAGNQIPQKQQKEESPIISNSKINNKKPSVTYNRKRVSKNKGGYLSKKEIKTVDYHDNYRVSKYQDTLWEAYDPKAGQINYYNRAKIKRTKPYFPALDKLEKNFGKSFDFSDNNAPKTEIQNFTMVTRPITFYPTSVKRLIR